MGELVNQLGLNWKLLLSQGVNFIILLVALTFLVYKPLARLLEERRKKIEFGLQGAEETERRLAEIEKIKEEKLTEADRKAMGIVSDAEKRGEKREDEILARAEIKSKEIMAEAARIAELKKEEELNRLTEKANALIKEAIIKTVELDPKHIDEKLISQAAKVIKEKAA